MPWIIIGSAVLAIPVALGSVRLISLAGPQSVTTGFYLVSFAALVVEWIAAAAAPSTVAVLVYLHLSIFSSVSISSFWSTVGECFDPYSAKRSMSRIASGAAVGGLLGGVLAERSAHVLSPTQSLVAIAVGHLAVSAICLRLQPIRKTDARSLVPNTFASARQIPRQRYLRNLSLLLLVSTASSTILDYLLKAQASRELSPSDLMRYLGIFYTGVGFATFAIQILLGRKLLERMGVALSTVPLSIATVLGGSVFVFAPGLTASFVARGSEAVVRNSLFRSS